MKRVISCSNIVRSLRRKRKIRGSAGCGTGRIDTAMLKGLSVRNIVLIERLDMTFSGGLSVLTGETGAGKSILLDALGLSIGARAEAGLVRAGSSQASVSATFQVAAGHAAYGILAESEIDAEDDVIILRRTLGLDGRRRAYVNDYPVSVSMLRRLGETLLEVHGQFDGRGGVCAVIFSFYE